MKKPIQILKEIALLESSARKAKAAKIIEFLDSGGWAILGHDSLKTLFKVENPDFGYSLEYFRKLIQGVNMELVLGIPPGTYAYYELQKLRCNCLMSGAYGQDADGTYSIRVGSSCDIKKALIARENWAKVQTFCDKQLPTATDLIEAVEKLYGDKSSYEKRRNYYSDKINELKAENAELKDENTELKEAIRHLEATIIRLRRERIKIA